jgi:hypothetical protein
MEMECSKHDRLPVQKGSEDAQTVGKVCLFAKQAEVVVVVF